MANTQILINVPDEPQFVRAVLTGGPVAPDVAGYDVTPLGNWEFAIAVPEACVGIYRLTLEDSDGLVQRQGWVRIVANDAGPYVAEGSYAAVQDNIGPTRDAILDRALAGNHDTAGTVGKALQQTASQADVSQLPAIKAKTDLIGTGLATISAPVTPEGQLLGPIIIGDDYLTTHTRAFIWTVDALTGVAVGNASCKFGGKKPGSNDAWLVTGSVADAGGGKWTITFELERSDTDDLTAGMYEWSAEVSDDSNNEVTRVRSRDYNYQVELVEKQT